MLEQFRRGAGYTEDPSPGQEPQQVPLDDRFVELANNVQPGNPDISDDGSDESQAIDVAQDRFDWGFED